MTQDRNYIHIADTNVLRVPTLRRYLFGLSAWHDTSLGVPPALMVVSELPLNLVMSVGKTARAWLKRRNDEAWRELFDKQTPDLLDWVYDWLDRGFEQGVFTALKRPDDALERSIAGEIGVFFKWRIANEEGTNVYLNHDLNMVVESIANEAGAVVTHNIRSIDHDRVNRWHSQRTGSNEKLLCSVSELSHRLCHNNELELEIAGAMAVSNSSTRSVNDEIRSIQSLVSNLDFNNEIDLAGRTWGVLNECDDLDRRHLVERSRELAATPAFRKVRDLNGAMVRITENLAQRIAPSRRISRG